MASANDLKIKVRHIQVPNNMRLLWGTPLEKQIVALIMNQPNFEVNLQAKWSQHSKCTTSDTRAPMQEEHVWIGQKISYSSSSSSSSPAFTREWIAKYSECTDCLHWFLISFESCVMQWQISIHVNVISLSIVVQNMIHNSEKKCSILIKLYFQK